MTTCLVTLVLQKHLSGQKLCFAASCSTPPQTNHICLVREDLRGLSLILFSRSGRTLRFYKYLQMCGVWGFFFLHLENKNSDVDETDVSV